MSAVEALAEVLRDLGAVPSCTNIQYANSDRMMQSWCGWCRMCVALAETAGVLVAAIRSMPAEQVAELIGGEVEKPDHPLVGVEGYQPTVRAVGPWLPLGVSPETNGEQK